LGGDGSINVTLAVESTEYGGYPPPVEAFGLRFPSGTILGGQGHPSCSEAVIVEAKEPEKCPSGSIAGPPGHAEGFVVFGGETVPEEFTTELFYASAEHLLMFIAGNHPAIVEATAKGTITGSDLSFEVPLIETVPGANDVSIKKLVLHFGETQAEEEASHHESGLSLPDACPTGRFSWSASLKWGAPTFAETTAEQAAETACPPESKKLAEEEAKKKAEEAALAKKKDEEEAALKKRHAEETKASVKVEKAKVTRRGVVVIIKTSEPGIVTLAGRGLKKKAKMLSAGAHEITVALTRFGRTERRERKKIKLLVDLTVGNKTVLASEKIRL